MSDYTVTRTFEQPSTAEGWDGLKPKGATQSFDILIKDKEREALEAASGGLCTIERTTNGQACHMFVLPKTKWEDLVPSGELGTGVHEAFLENGVEKSEILLGMYQAATKKRRACQSARVGAAPINRLGSIQ